MYKFNRFNSLCYFATTLFWTVFNGNARISFDLFLIATLAYCEVALCERERHGAIKILNLFLILVGGTVWSALASVFSF